mmetsp:Transcript_41208/g.132704  ORF Transcript_41208/g.132704 Transcript_41208/m.132704 type:complete len:469 (-) Transcript_41208:413-1819(-)
MSMPLGLSSSSSMVGNGTGRWSDGEARNMTVDLALDDAVFAAFCRRGRKRLKEMQNTYSVALRLNRDRCQLQVTGKASAVAAVKKHVAMMSGPRRMVSAALWAEFMRTRTIQGTEALIERLQEGCGCRVHIERSQHEVRIFGDSEAVAKADKLLEDLASQCTQSEVGVADRSALSARALDALARSSGVSLRVEQDCVMVLGMQDAVAKAIGPLREYIGDPTSHPLHSLEDACENPQAAEIDSFGAQTGDDDDGEVNWNVRDGRELGLVPPFSNQGRRPNATGTRTTNVHEQPQQEMQQMQHHQQHQQRHQQQKPASGQPARGVGACCVCPTCGCGRFCGSCGAAVWQAPADDLQNYMPGSSMMYGPSGVMWSEGGQYVMAAPQASTAMVSGPPSTSGGGGYTSSGGQMVPLPVCVITAPAGANGSTWMSGSEGPSMMQMVPVLEQVTFSPSGPSQGSFNQKEKCFIGA